MSPGDTPGQSKESKESTMRYEPNWESLQAYTVPEWFKDAKLGIFIHWGVYAVPAFDNEWYPRFMYRDEISRKGPNYFQHHREAFGPQDQFGYKDFIPMFKAENWDPEAWIELF
jgi:alpha-L-fucosidase